MQPTEITSRLLALTPYFLEGFAMNILVAAVAMVVGTLAGWALALLRLSGRARWEGLSMALTDLSCGVPTIVFQFYLAFVLPGELALPGSTTTLVLPPWLKASLALALAVVGFTSDNLATALRDWRIGHHRAAILFIPSWTSYALIIVMASSTASIIGVGELLSHCNTAINASGNTQLMLPIYLYACVIFFSFCFPLTLLMKQLSLWLARRLPVDGGSR